MHTYHISVCTEKPSPVHLQRLLPSNTALSVADASVSAERTHKCLTLLILSVLKPKLDKARAQLAHTHANTRKHGIV